MKIIFRLMFLTVFVHFLSACSITAEVDELIPPSQELLLQNNYPGSVSVAVIGGDKRIIPSEVFAEALATTLKESGLFSDSTDGNLADYSLRVTILNANQSFLAYTVETNSQWVLTDASGDVLWQERVSGSGSSAAFAGVTRVRTANERAAKDCIKNGVEALSRAGILAAD